MTMGNMDSHIQNPVWREGLHRIINVDPPGVGQEWSVQVPQVPEGIWWRVKAVTARFAASAVAGNRSFRVLVDTGNPGNVYAVGAQSSNVAAGVTAEITLEESMNPSGLMLGVAGVPVNRIVGPWPFDVRIAPGHFVRSETGVIDTTPVTGDQYSGVRLLVQELIYVPAVDYISGALSLAADRIIAAVKASGGCGCPLVVGEAVGSPTG